jgi:hypothetical protein
MHDCAMPTITIDQIKRALHVAEEIEKLQGELNRILGGSVSAPPAAAPEAVKKGKRTMSESARARIAAAQRARWAKAKAKPAEPAAKPKEKGGMSAAGRANIIAAQKARWARVRAAKAGIPAAKPKAGAKKKAKRNISPEGRARMLEALKRRWAKQKGARR